MKAEDVKIGEKYIVLDETKCSRFKNSGGEYIIVTGFYGYSKALCYDIYDNKNVKITECSICLKPEDLIPYEKTLETLETLEVGDILVEEDGDEFMVLGICGKVYFLSYYNNFETLLDFGMTLNEIKDRGFKLKQPEPKDQTRELTQEEIEKELGYKIKIKK